MSEFFMIIDGETHKIPVERIHSFKIENYYLEAIFPIFKVVISLESARYYAMIKNKDKVKFKIRIQTYSHNVDTPSEHSMNKDLINDTFVFFPEASRFCITIFQNSHMNKVHAHCFSAMLPPTIQPSQK